MSSFFLQPGLIILRYGQHLEFAARSESEIYFEEPSTGKRVTLNEDSFWEEYQAKQLKIVNAFSSEKELVIPQGNEGAQLRSLIDLAPKYQQDVNRKLFYINKLKELGISRGQKFLIADAVKKLADDIGDELGAPGASTVQNWWKRLETQHCEVYVLISGNANRKRSSQFDGNSESFLKSQIDDKYLLRTQPTVRGAYKGYGKALKETNEKRELAGMAPLEKVAERTFYSRIDELPKYDVAVARLGREAARKANNMIKGHLPSDHPLETVEFDHTPLNLFVIDDLCFLPLGRPWITAIKDRNTGILLGFYVSFRRTGLDCIFGAIKHSLSSHHLAYQRWPDIENPWPAFGLGTWYFSDRGGDFISPRYRFAIKDIGAQYAYAERRTPWVKGSIERFFLTLEQTFFESMPGRTFANLAARGDYDSKKDAVVRFTTLVYLLHKWAADYHNITPNSRKIGRPLDLWLEGIGIAPPPYPTSLDALNITLGDRHSGILSHEGLRFKHLNFANDELHELMKLLGKGISLDFVVVREDLGWIHVKHPKTNNYFEVPNTRLDYASGLSLFQHQYLVKEARIELDQNPTIDKLIETRAHMQQILAGELEAKKNATKAKLAQLAGINSNVILGGNTPSIINPFGDKSGDAKCNDEQPAPKEPSFINIPKYSWG